MPERVETLTMHHVEDAELAVAISGLKKSGLEKLADPTCLYRYWQIRAKVGAQLLLEYGRDVDRYLEDFKNLQFAMFPGVIDKHLVNELLTGDFVADLADYIVRRAPEVKPVGVCNIAEVGAGQGAVTRRLTDRLFDYPDNNIRIQASDNYDYADLLRLQPAFEVARMGYQEALDGNPDMVISSWMPGDWLDVIMDTASVEEIVLIGEPKSCGHYKTTRDHQNGGVYNGFKRVELPGVSRRQIGFTDNLYPFEMVGRMDLAAEARKSRTISYRRV